MPEVYGNDVLVEGKDEIDLSQVVEVLVFNMEMSERAVLTKNKGTARFTSKRFGFRPDAKGWVFGWRAELEDA